MNSSYSIINLFCANRLFDKQNEITRLYEKQYGLTKKVYKPVLVKGHCMSKWSVWSISILKNRSIWVTFTTASKAPTRIGLSLNLSHGQAPYRTCCVT